MRVLCVGVSSGLGPVIRVRARGQCEERVMMRAVSGAQPPSPQLPVSACVDITPLVGSRLSDAVSYDIARIYVIFLWYFLCRTLRTISPTTKCNDHTNVL